MKRMLFALLACALAALLASCASGPVERLAAGAFEGSVASSTAEPEGAYLVPVAHLASPLEDVSERELSGSYRPLVPAGLSEGVSELLGVERVRSSGSAEEVVRRVSRDPEAVGLVPWQAVDGRVKALSVEGVAPLSPDAGSLEGYPLVLGAADAPERERLRRVVIGGDVVLDRGLPYAVYNLGGGRSFPLDGGYAAVTERWSVPSEFSEYGYIHEFSAERVGGAGAVREYLRGADLTLANLESPVLRDAVWHAEGTVFHGDLDLLPVLKDGGIDGVALANNHILDAGAPGLAETLGHLERAGIEHTGAGEDLAAAREPMVFDLGGVKVGVLNYQNVPDYEWAWATGTTPGTAPLRADLVRRDVKRLKEQVDVVIVMPHWGNEYLATPEPDQVGLAREIVAAGADLVVGGHAHWAKGMEVRQGAPVFYGLGNFLFDQTWSEETSTGIFAEVTLYDGRVVQARPVPYLVLDYAQPNFLLGTDRDRALAGVFSASVGPEFEAYTASGE